MATNNRKKNSPSASGNFRTEFTLWLSDAKAIPQSMETRLAQLQQFADQLLSETPESDKLDSFREFATTVVDALPQETPEDRIKLQLWVGHAFEKMGGWDEALAAFQRVADLSTTAKAGASYSEAHLWIGHLLLMQSKNNEALKAYQQSLSIARNSGLVKSEIEALNGLAYYAFEQGEIADAAYRWEQALELAETENDVSLIAKLKNNLGTAANVRGKWETALALYSECLPLCEKTGDLRGLAETHHNIGMTYADANRHADASLHYQKSLQFAKETGDMRLQALVKLNRVELTIAIGDMKLAEALAKQALRSFLDLDDKLGEADVYKFLGVIYSYRREWEVATAHFKKSIQLTRKFENPLGEAESRWEYARMLFEKGRKSSAKKEFESAMQLFLNLNAEKEVAAIREEIIKLS